MLHTEPPYSNYGTKIFGVQTGRIETRHLFSVDGQRGQELKLLGFKGNKGAEVIRSSQGQGVLKNSSQIELDS